MPPTICPFLGTFDENYNQAPPVDYPSFENRCLANSEDESLLLPDQATFCLGSSHQLCARFQAAQRLVNARRPQAAPQTPPHAQPVFSPPPASNDIPFIARQPLGKAAAFPAGDQAMADQATEDHAAVDDFLADLYPTDNGDDYVAERRRWGWIGAAALFLGVIFFGSLLAVYVGWQVMSQRVAAGGRIQTVSDLPVAQPTPQVIYVTAQPGVGEQSNPVGSVAVNSPPLVNTDPNSNSNTVGQTVDQAPIDPVAPPIAATATINFPPAVTATPLPDQAAQNENDDAPVVVVKPPEPPPLIAVTPLIDVNALVPPTRRPTPVLDGEIAAITQITVSKPITALATLTPTNTATPAGPPIVIFGAVDAALAPGKCTIVRWDVQNVKEVYYDFIGVNGKGESEECIRETDGLFSLDVVHFSGQKQTYTTTVKVLLPTSTPLPTPSFTPEPIFTATWTPEPPPATPTPNVRYAVALAVQNGVDQTCQPGALCTIGLLVTNSGDAVDHLTVHLLQGAWSPQLCRVDGVCGNTSLTVAAIGPANTAFVELRITVPAEATNQSAPFQLNASSDGSGGLAVSDQVLITVKVP